MNGLRILPRALEASLTSALRSFPVVVVTGSRQTGKSTLVRPLEGRPYLTLDNLEILERARQQPDALEPALRRWQDVEWIAEGVLAAPWWRVI